MTRGSEIFSLCHGRRGGGCGLWSSMQSKVLMRPRFSGTWTMQKSETATHPPHVSLKQNAHGCNAPS